MLHNTVSAAYRHKRQRFFHATKASNRCFLLKAPKKFLEVVKIILESESTSDLKTSTAETIKNVLQSNFENIQVSLNLEDIDNSKEHFIVEQFKSSLSKDRKKVYIKNELFHIQYCLPEGTADRNQKYIQTGDSLYEYLENIPFSNSVLQGNNMHYKISDGKLVFSIMYTQRLVLQEPASPLMGKLYQKDNIRV